jgi:hypothetical protein
MGPVAVLEHGSLLVAQPRRIRQMPVVMRKLRQLLDRGGRVAQGGQPGDQRLACDPGLAAVGEVLDGLSAW